MNIMHLLVQYGIGAIILAMLIRAIASMMQLDERIAFIRFLARITDPFIDPVRQVVKPIGVFDLSFFITWFLLGTMTTLFLQALPVGW